MPSAFAHAAIGASLAAHMPHPVRSSHRLWITGLLAIAAAAPDLDVIGFRLGIPYDHALGHRGLTHSLFFAAGVGVASWPLWRLARVECARTASALTFFAVASHGLLDAFTDAGLGVGLLIPLDDTRYFAPVRPLLTSPLSVRSFFSPAGLSILWNEIVWIGPLGVALVLGPVLTRISARLRRDRPSA